MRKNWVYLFVILSIALLGLGVAPRYLENLKVGGGFGSIPDGGVDLESDGDISADGNAAIKGQIDGGNATATDRRVSVTASGSGYPSVDLYSGGTSNGGRLWFDGPANALALGTRAGSATPVKALTVDEGSDDVKVAGSVWVGDGSDLETIRFAGPGATFRRLEFYTGSASNLANRRWMFGASEHPELGQYAGSAFVINSWDNSGNFISNVLFMDRDPGVPVKFNKSVTSSGDLTAQDGDVVAGVDGATRGVVTLWDGSGGAAPGCVKIASPNGTLWYLFVEDDGTLKVSNTVPTANGDGTAVGTQF
ncbi:MAG: hypothetical protein AMXMBFR84_04090 [Candidatus Hydrogenedentota bacterium]